MFGSCGMPGPVTLLISRATPAKKPMDLEPKVTRSACNVGSCMKMADPVLS